MVMSELHRRFTLNHAAARRLAWYGAALIVLSVAAWANMRAWFVQDLLPPGDFAGYASVVEQVRDSLLRYGRVPIWCSDCFGGSSYFVSSLKEYAAFPLALWLDPVLATKLLFLILKLLSALGLYLIFARLFGSPAAGIVAGYAYAFGAWSNHETGHLDVPFSSALFPLIFLASVGLLARRSLRWAGVLGFLVACQLAINWVQALVCPVLFVTLLAFRPWRSHPGEDDPVADRGLAARWALSMGAALLVFLLFAASQIGWTVADSGNHWLVDPEVAAEQRERYSERSPFLFLNRDNWMASWLTEHDPLQAKVPRVDTGRRYLGVVAIAVCVGGWFAARRRYGLRRWYQAGALLLLFQYWMALGPHTLVSQIARSFHWAESVDASLRLWLTLTSVGCLGTALFRRARRQEDASDRPFENELLLGSALLLVFPAYSLWEIARTALPILSLQRSPGHFSDVLPFSFYLLFGLGLTAIARASARPRVAHALVATVGVLVAIDFWPSTRAFRVGTPMEAVRRARQTVAELPGEGGTLRMNLTWINSPLRSLVGMNSEAGRAWGWLPWQAGRHWPPYMSRAAWPFRQPREETEETIRSDEALLALGRLKYFLLDSRARNEPRALPHPWRPVASSKLLSVWEQPEVAPMASGYRSYLLVVGEPHKSELRAIPPLFHRNVLVASVGGRSSDLRELIGEATLVSLPDESALGDEASRALAQQHAHKVFDPRDVSGWRKLGTAPVTALVGVDYRRPAPEHIVLEIDAGELSSLIFLSEGYHPWWRATLNGERVPLVRAQMAFMAVLVPPGEHVVDVRFQRPIAVAAADAVTGLSWLTAAIGVPVAGIAIALGRRR